MIYKIVFHRKHQNVLFFHARENRIELKPPLCIVGFTRLATRPPGRPVVVVGSTISTREHPHQGAMCFTKTFVALKETKLRTTHDILNKGQARKGLNRPFLTLPSWTICWCRSNGLFLLPLAKRLISKTVHVSSFVHIQRGCAQGVHLTKILSPDPQSPHADVDASKCPPLFYTTHTHKQPTNIWSGSTQASPPPSLHPKIASFRRIPTPPNAHSVNNKATGSDCRTPPARPISPLLFLYKGMCSFFRVQTRYPPTKHPTRGPLNRPQLLVHAKHRQHRRDIERPLFSHK